MDKSFVKIGTKSLSLSMHTLRNNLVVTAKNNYCLKKISYETRWHGGQFIFMRYRGCSTETPCKLDR